MKDFVAITKAISDANRVRIVLALRRGELCVCRLIALLGLAPSTVSKHMSVLKNAGLVSGRKEERWIYYRIVPPRGQSSIVKDTLGWMFRSLAAGPDVINDAERLVHILKQSPESLCRKRAKRLK